jgi:hypothetical protein
MQLTLWQKRQATLLYHFMSREYLLGLLQLLNELIGNTDDVLDTAHVQRRDGIITDPRWGVRDTSANWSTYGFSALLDFRKCTIEDIALHDQSRYGITGVNQCANMLREYSTRWMTEDEEAAFKVQFDKIYLYASEIDDVVMRRIRDYNAYVTWTQNAHLFPRLPKFMVHTDIVGESGQLPPKTGVYVPQDDPYGTLQFAWTTDSDGQLRPAKTLTPLALEAVNTLGRDKVWAAVSQDPAAQADGKVADFMRLALKQGRLTHLGPYKPEDAKRPGSAAGMLPFSAFVDRPCKWYYVERIEGEYEDPAETTTAQVIAEARLRVEANQPCPQTGWWMTPAKAGSRRYFNEGEIMPSLGGGYGLTIWQWDVDQSAPKL